MSDTITVQNPPEDWQLGDQVEHNGLPFVVWHLTRDWGGYTEAELLHGEIRGDMIVDNRTCEQRGYHDWRNASSVFIPHRIEICARCSQSRRGAPISDLERAAMEAALDVILAHADRGEFLSGETHGA